MPTTFFQQTPQPLCSPLTSQSTSVGTPTQQSLYPSTLWGTKRTGHEYATPKVAKQHSKMHDTFVLPVGIMSATIKVPRIGASHPFWERNSEKDQAEVLGSIVGAVERYAVVHSR